MAGRDEFDETRGDEAWAEPSPAERLVVDLDGYAGPLDVLLELARTQKVDLTRISILQLDNPLNLCKINLKRLSKAYLK